MSTVLALHCPPQCLAQVDRQGPKFTKRRHHLNYFGICIKVLFWQNIMTFCCYTIGNVCVHLADVCTFFPDMALDQTDAQKRTANCSSQSK